MGKHRYEFATLKNGFLVASVACLSVWASPSFSSDSRESKKDFEPKIKNSLDNCTQVSINDVYRHENIIFATITLDLKQGIGHCGCRSAIASYSVYKRIGSQIKTYVYAPFSLKESRLLEVPLLIEPSLISEPELILSFQCSST